MAFMDARIYLACAYPTHLTPGAGDTAYDILHGLAGFILVRTCCW